ncbi:MAG: glycosyl hydrolase family 18 protein [Planctomycetota bacterium]
MHGKVVVASAGALLALALVTAGCGGDGGGSSQPFASAATTAGAHSGSATPTSTASSSGTTTSPTTAASPSPATSPAPAGPRYVVSGWLPAWARTHGDAMIDANTGIALDEVNLFGWGLKPDGTLIRATGMDDPARVALVRSRGGEVIPTIYDVNDANALEAVLASASARAQGIRSMLNLLDQGGYDGIDLDFEHAKASNRDAFSAWVAELGREVKARGKVFSVTIPGKRADLPSWAGYDYAALGAAADRIKIMTYGYSGTWTNYPGGPVAPTDWIEKVLDYAVTVIPPGKIQVGIPFYGYDWADDGSTARSVTYLRSQTLLTQTGAVVSYQPTRGEAKFTYTSGGVNHTVWFSEERSIAAKAALVKRYGLLGLSVWALGYGDPPVWDAIRQTLK